MADAGRRVARRNDRRNWPADLTVFAQGQTVELVEQRLRERVVKLEQIIYKGDVP